MEGRNEIRDVVDMLQKIMIAIQSLNPDPTQTIGEYRGNQNVSRTLNYISIGIASLSLLVAFYAIFRTQSVGILLQGN